MPCVRVSLCVSGAAETVYAGETYRMRIRFPVNYPIEAPEVVFVPVGKGASHVSQRKAGCGDDEANVFPRFGLFIPQL